MGFGHVHALTIALAAAACGARTTLEDSADAARVTVVQISAGRTHTCALLSSGGIRCWGDNEYGQLGDGSRTQRTTPVDVVSLGGPASLVSAGGQETCALLTSGAVRCWGALGDGTATASSIPVDVALGSAAVHVSAGWAHACAVLSSGAVRCWGYNQYGQLGDGTTTDHPTPVDVRIDGSASRVSAGTAHTCALLSSGSLMCWGDNYAGDVGDGTTSPRTLPTAVDALGGEASVVSAGGAYTCALVSGALRCWGSNGAGQLGDSTTTIRLRPVDVPSLGVDVSQVSTGWSATCALLTSGTVSCWGYDSFGVLGDGMVGAIRTSPASASVVGAAAQVSVGETHACALRSSGTVTCWGFNQYGELGDGTTTDSVTPVMVVGMP